ncbi:hypothetical protein ABC977_02300 [Thioalkalicoccus limnaeus]|uniref:Uncharacterized protein n=1 Tax=Thioalkalicoccus limnaeus TaxID=120681 RepID=A0ABV4BA10_9GAMM
MKDQNKTHELAISIKTLNHEIRLLQSEYAEAPSFSWSKRMKVGIAEEIVRLEARRADYVRQLARLKGDLRSIRQTGMHPPKQTRQKQPIQASGSMRKVDLQRRIDELYTEIEAIGKQIASMPYTEQRKQRIQEHQHLIRERRRLIWQISAA